MKNKCKEVIKADFKRYNYKPNKYIKTFIILFRKSHFTKNRFVKACYRFLYHRHSIKRGIEISSRINIGEGLYIGHPFCININDGVSLGKNINIHKGVTIGQENRGIRKGCPTIGNDVWIGVNATIIGKITIGNDVLIAPNSYVNFDVPDHSVVIGNPGRIIQKDNATKNYINNRV